MARGGEEASSMIRDSIFKKCLDNGLILYLIKEKLKAEDSHISNPFATLLSPADLKVVLHQIRTLLYSTSLLDSPPQKVSL